MATRRISDLRDPEARRSMPSVGAASPPRREAVASALPPQQSPKKERGALLSWRAPEYHTESMAPYWHVWLGAGAAVMVIVGALIQSFFFVAFVILAYAVVLMYAARSPREVSCAVRQDGIVLGRHFWRFGDIKSFAIMESGAVPELSLEIDRIASPYLRLPLGDIHPNRVRAALADFLPEEQHKEFLTDHIARTFGF